MRSGARAPRARFVLLSAGGRGAAPRREDAMPDLAFVLGTLGFFVLAWLYALACDRL
jgi:hypothetical protein